MKCSVLLQTELLKMKRKRLRDLVDRPSELIRTIKNVREKGETISLCLFKSLVEQNVSSLLFPVIFTGEKVTMLTSNLFVGNIFRFSRHRTE